MTFSNKFRARDQVEGLEDETDVFQPEIGQAIPF